MKSAIVLITLMACAAAQASETFGPFDVDGGHITCKSPSGDEIKKTAVFRATPDRFFKENSILVQEIAGYAPKKHGCDLIDVRRANIPVHTDFGEVEVSVIKEFSVYAYADCGTDMSQFFGKTASVECSAMAEMVKYTNH